MHSVRKVGVLALVAALAVVLGAIGPARQTPQAEAFIGLASPGGLAVLPTAAPAVPGLNNQSTPAIIGTGQYAIVAVFCFNRALPLAANPCPDADGSSPIGSGSITLELTKLYPTGGGIPGATFTATGTNRLVVEDNGGADLDAAIGVVTVQVNAAAATQGGTQGVNEIVEVRATDETGDSRTGQLVTVDTILAFGPTGPLSTAAQEQPMLVAYHCDVVGRSPVAAVLEEPIQTLRVPGPTDPDGDGNQGLDDMYDGYYSPAFDGIGPGLGYGSNTLAGDVDLPDVWCGGNTPALFDDFVDFQTDLGLFTVQPVARELQAGSIKLAATEVVPNFVLGYFFPPILDTGCGEGKSVDVFDVDALSAWAAWLLGGFPAPAIGSRGLEGGCDVDGWRNSVVTTFLLGNGEVGTATITAQQGGGVSPVRTVNVTFIGLPGLSLFLESPATMGLEGGEFTVAVVDPSFRFIGDETISCTLDPPDSGLIIVPQTGTTGGVTSDLPAQVVMRIVPTGAAVVAGGTLTVVCQVDRYPSIRAVAVIPLVTFESESVDLVKGCNPLAATWPDATSIDTVVTGVAPAEALDAIWLFDPASGAWQGYSPAAPEASDLESVNNLDAIFVCMNAPGTIGRPVI